MPRTFLLVAITSHVPVEIGDHIYPAGFPDGIVADIREDRKEVSIAYYNGEAYAGTMSTSLEGAGLYFIDSAYVVERPEDREEPFDHKPGLISLNSKGPSDV